MLRALYDANGIQSLYGGDLFDDMGMRLWFSAIICSRNLNKIVQNDPIFGNVSNLGLWLTLLCFALVQIVP